MKFRSHRSRALLALPGLIVFSMPFLAQRAPEAVSRAEVASPGTGYEAAQPVGRFLDSIGVNIHLAATQGVYQNLALVERSLRDLGITHVRDQGTLRGDTSNRTVYSRWDQLGRDGIRFDAVVDPRRGRNGDLASGVLDQLAQLSGGSIELFEGPENLDRWGDPDWAMLLRSYQQQMRAAQQSGAAARGIRLVGPALADVDRNVSIGSLAEAADYGNLHAYPSGRQPSYDLAHQLSQAAVMYPGLPVLVTETGYNDAAAPELAPGTVPESVAARYLPRLLLEYFAAGIPRTYLYELFDELPDPSGANADLHWGLLRSDGSPKPAYAALATMHAILAETGDAGAESAALLHYALTGAAPPLRHVLLARRNGAFILALWQEVRSYENGRREVLRIPARRVTLRFPAPADITVYDLQHGTSPQRGSKAVEEFGVDVADEVLLLEISPPGGKKHPGAPGDLRPGP